MVNKRESLTQCVYDFVNTMVLNHPERNEIARLLLHFKYAIKGSLLLC